MKPPVDAPISRHVFPVTSTPKSSSAPSSFSPPRLAYFADAPLISIRASAGNLRSGLVASRPVDANFAGQDHGLRLFARFGKSSLDDQ